MDGFLVVNKSLGYTSRDVVNIVGGILNTKKIGHTGTLDPNASGVLIICLGKALKMIELMDDLDKEYEAEIILGLETDTLDTDKNATVIKEEKVGGQGGNVWQRVGISYWNEADGHRLSADIPDVYQSPGGKERYWEQVPLVYKKDHYSVEVRECFDEDIVEIDTFKELKAIDKTYDV